MIRFAALLLLALSAWFAFSSAMGFPFGVDLVAVALIVGVVSVAMRRTVP